MSNSIIDKRASVRAFTDEAVSNEDVRSILAAAMAAPSAGNQQPWSFYVVRDQPTRDALAAASKYAGSCSKAPVVLVLCLSEDVRIASMVQQDMGACAENALLRITELGLGGVWLGIYPEQDRVRKAAEVLGTPEGVVPFAFIALGHPAQPVQAKGPTRYDERRVVWMS